METRFVPSEGRVSLPSMKSPLSQQHLTGWRSQAWALVLFVALLRGLLPHAALAGLLDNGNPELAWCAPGKAPPGEDRALAAHAACVCAPAGESLAGSRSTPTLGILPIATGAAAAPAQFLMALRPPAVRARGPPLTLG